MDVKITIETASGDLYRRYRYDQSPLEIQWGEVVEDMFDTIEKSQEIMDSTAKDHASDEMVNHDNS